MIAATGESPEPRALPAEVKRHRLSTRIWHWVNALALFVMLMSGLMIFNAHPRLYWGHYGANADPAWLEIGSDPGGGYLKLGATRIGTTGALGQSTDSQGQIQNRAFPAWATIPSSYDLAGARRWHLAFAWVLGLGLLLFLIRAFINRHAQRDLVPKPAELRPRHLWREVKDHARLRFPTGEAALRYNILQKLSYFAVIFLALPLIILTGFAMSPGIDAAWPILVDMFGGRQSARSIHFITAFLLVAFVIVHLVMVVLAGPINEVRAMITGRYRLPRAREKRP
ncbi:MAG TPA: cytochrome b/b6 domain-containing protein [Allosphingosinicella sp.]